MPNERIMRAVENAFLIALYCFRNLPNARAYIRDKKRNKTGFPQKITEIQPNYVLFLGFFFALGDIPQITANIIITHAVKDCQLFFGKIYKNIFSLVFAYGSCSWSR